MRSSVGPRDCRKLWQPHCCIVIVVIVIFIVIRIVIVVVVLVAIAPWLYASLEPRPRGVRHLNLGMTFWGTRLMGARHLCSHIRSGQAALSLCAAM